MVLAIYSSPNTLCVLYILYEPPFQFERIFFILIFTEFQCWTRSPSLSRQ